MFSNSVRLFSAEFGEYGDEKMGNNANDVSNIGRELIKDFLIILNQNMRF